ncbi:MAG: NADP-dependent oxidoreductase [Clostridium sp.]|nr:NADP-dependent oxidoreductase [Clostridium sp.]
MAKNMEAFIIKEFGGYEVLNKEKVKIPNDIKENEILIKLSAASYNPSDKKVREGAFKKVTPINDYRIIGFDFSGEIIKIGENIKNYKISDKVFGYQSIKSNGSYGEYLKTKANNICLSPKNISLEDSAALSVAGTASYKSFLSLDLAKHKNILINGVSGGVGTYLLQILKIENPNIQVTGTASERSFKLIEQLNIDKIIDYTKVNIYDSYNEKYDAVINLVELTDNNINKLLGLIKENGILISTTNKPSKELIKEKNLKFESVFANPDKKILEELKYLVERKGLKPIITSTYNFDEIKEVHKNEEQKASNGKLLIKY